VPIGDNLNDLASAKLPRLFIRNVQMANIETHKYNHVTLKGKVSIHPTLSMKTSTKTNE
jgi:hypothetical protein